MGAPGTGGKTCRGRLTLGKALGAVNLPRFHLWSRRKPYMCVSTCKHYPGGVKYAWDMRYKRMCAIYEGVWDPYPEAFSASGPPYLWAVKDPKRGQYKARVPL
jgi:hypothetical protein